MITLSADGDFTKTRGFIERLKETMRLGILDKYGREGVKVLSEATPVDTGETARSWSYEITWKKNSATLSFYNSNVVDGVSVAVILQYGHGTRNGGWIEGRDYINPALQPVFDRLVDELTREVSKV